MTFDRLRPIGSWNGTLEDTELEQFDENLSNAIDGAAGGAYAPTEPIVIGGEGLEVEGLFKASGTMDFVGSTFFVQASTIFLVNGDATFTNGEVEFEDTITGVDATFSGDVAADNVTTTGDISVGGAFEVLGASVFEGAVDFNNDITVDLPSGGNFVINGASGPMFGASSVFGMVLSEALSLNDAGRIKYRVTHATDADGTFSVSTADIVTIQNANTLNADRIWEIDDDGAVDGMTMQVSIAMDGTANTVAIRRSNASLIIGLSGNGLVSGPTGSVGGQYWPSSCTLVRDGGQWNLLHALVKDPSYAANS